MPEDGEDGDTSIRISIDTWQKLKDLKQRPNQSYDDVIRDLLEEDEEGNPKRSAPMTAD